MNDPAGPGLSRAECLQRLASASLGRLVYTDRALPAAYPATFALDGERAVVVRVLEAGILLTARDAVVAFVIDYVDPDVSAGWVVTVVGHATETAASQLFSSQLRSNSSTAASHYLVIELELLAGRRIG